MSEEQKMYYINGVSGDSFTIVTPDPDLAEDIYDAYWSEEECPVPGCGETMCDDHFINDETADHMIDFPEASEGKFLNAEKCGVLVRYLQHLLPEHHDPLWKDEGKLGNIINILEDLEIANGSN